MTMISSGPTTWKFLAVLALILLLTGCARSVPISYYQLAATGGNAGGQDIAPAAGLVIGIGPVRLQENLDRPQLISHIGANQLQLDDRHRWAQPLAENIAWVLRENLSALLGTEQLLLYPWERATTVNYQVVLEILHCEGMADGTAQLTVLWSVIDRNGKTLLPQRRGSYQVPPATPDQGGLVSALSEALSRLSLDMARELSRLRDAAPKQDP